MRRHLRICYQADVVASHVAEQFAALKYDMQCIFSRLGCNRVGFKHGTVFRGLRTRYSKRRYLR